MCTLPYLTVVAVVTCIIIVAPIVVVSAVAVSVVKVLSTTVISTTIHNEGIIRILGMTYTGNSAAQSQEKQAISFTTEAPLVLRDQVTFRTFRACIHFLVRKPLARNLPTELTIHANVLNATSSCSSLTSHCS